MPDLSLSLAWPQEYSIAARLRTPLLYSPAEPDYAAMRKSRQKKTLAEKSAAMKARIEWLLSLDGVTPRYLADHFGFKHTSAISSWKTTGRVDKGHLPDLADLSDTIDRWWLLDDVPIPPTAEWRASTASTTIPRPPWPFVRVDERRLSRVPEGKIRLLELALLEAADSLEIVIRKPLESTG